MSNLIIKLIRLYQKIPIKTHNLCRYTPTCSEYMIISIERFGLIKGMYLGIKRILRCNPFGSYGYDPVPERKKKMKRIKRIFTILLCSLILTGCNVLEDNSMNDIEVYTTIYPYNYLISYLYGNNSKVNSIYPNGIDLNKYKLSEKKINEYSKSDLFVFSSLDEKEREIAVKMVNNNKDLKLIDVNMGMSINNSIEELWLNPYNYLMMAKNVKDGLNEYIDNKLLNDSINKSYEELQYEISNLDASIKEMVGNANYSTIITNNEALKFLEKYKIEVLTIEDDIDEIKKIIGEGKIRYLYTLNQEDNEDTNNLVSELNIELIKLNSMKSIDGLIETANDNYFNIMNENLELINKELEK